MSISNTAAADDPAPQYQRSYGSDSQESYKSEQRSKSPSAQYVTQQDFEAQRIVTRAHELIGAPYRWGGDSVEEGFDCSGLLVYLYRDIAKLELPRNTKSMLAQRHKTVKRHELQPGDAVFFSGNGSRRVSHVGLYIGKNRFIHAPRGGKAVRIDSMANRYWHKSYTTARRFRG